MNDINAISFNRMSDCSLLFYSVNVKTNSIVDRVKSQNTLFSLHNTLFRFICFAGAYGLCLGCWFLLVPVLLADAFGTARIASSYGLVRMFQSIAAVSVPPTAGKTLPY
jgi:hypothetical protein